MAGLWIALLVPGLWLARNLIRLLTFKPDYVYVEDDGSIRPVTPDEQTYLETEFLPNDLGRPYIKVRYWEHTPDGRLGGFLHRTDIPLLMRPGRLMKRDR